MINITEYIASGILESYVLGMTTGEEKREVEILAQAHDEIRRAINTFSKVLEIHLQDSAIVPPITIKPMIMATFDYMSRLQQGEQMTFPPLLHEGSKISDYADWLNRPDMVLSHDFKEIQAKIIGHTPQVTTAIVWISEMAPAEVHNDEYERFLVIEGTCTITIAQKVHQLVPGDFLSIPLYAHHHVIVTSPIPCKVILQRVAA